jgi:hypothetical protein
MALKTNRHTTTGTWGYTPSRTNGGVQSQYAWQDDLIISTSVNPGGNNPFTVEHRTTSGSVINGVGGSYGYSNFPTVFYGRSYSYGSAPTAADGRRLIAMTNPSRPTVLLPVYLKELGDLPEMVRQAGRIGIAIRDGVSRGSLLKDLTKAKNPTAALAAANLGFQFGWRPLVQDLWTFATFQDSVDKRKKELKKLREEGLRRTVKKLWSSGFNQSFNTALGEGFNSVRITERYQAVASGGVIWKETYTGSSDLPDADIRARLLGLTPDAIAANVWEALPWSWFTDYFNDIGAMIQAGNRTIATPVRAWTKVVSTCNASHPTVFGGTSGILKNVTLSGGQTTWKRISRFPATGQGAPNEAAHIPILGLGQLSILGSLAVVKNRKVLGLSQ